MTPESQRLFEKNLRAVQRSIDQLFFWLLLGQWAFAIGVSLFTSPYTWEGTSSSLHLHVKLAVGFGALINALPLLLIRFRPGSTLTRHVVAMAQMLWSGLLIHLTDGRIETHFHVFGSLAFLSLYRDWKLYPTATLMVVIDHLTRAFFWPESVYGVANPEWWRFLEHAGWVLFEDAVLLRGCQLVIREMKLVADREAMLAVTNARVEQEVHERTSQLSESMKRYRALVENSNAIPFEYDLRSGRLSYVAPQCANLFGYDDEQLIGGAGFFTAMVRSDDQKRVKSHVERMPADESAHLRGDQFDFGATHRDGRKLELRTIVSPLQPGEPMRGLLIDVTAQKRLEEELRMAQKLESVGRLAAGVAHEINTPVQFVSDSIHFLRDAAKDIISVVEKLQVVRQSVEEGRPSMPAVHEANAFEEEVDLGYLAEKVPRAFDRSLDGLQRVATIVRSMKTFAHPGSSEMQGVDLNQAIDSTLTIAKSEYKYVADVETRFGELPLVVCHIGDINQAVLNIVINAAHAIGDRVKGTTDKGLITVTTRVENQSVVVDITDNGGGIPEAARSKIFEPFFTTKEVGRGTGQGLAIARAVVVEKHKGELWFDTELGTGTTFHLKLPLPQLKSVDAFTADPVDEATVAA